jgi:hypothetical protein
MSGTLLRRKRLYRRRAADPRDRGDRLGLSTLGPSTLGPSELGSSILWLSTLGPSTLEVPNNELPSPEPSYFGQSCLGRPTAGLADSAAHLRGDGGGGTETASAYLSLADLMTATWQGLSAREIMPCPVCHGAMAPCDEAVVWWDEPLGASETLIYGECEDCGAQLR